ncbi:sensor histidine kinase [Sphingomicrobium astaxanthinifaciens]|uniref:sensor histidine kinase n=1 Tax=Sphingomicrobium astaxanthinifaciens TaxID=1227949 RepID=UPI001FCC202B|nr:HWE histidine kinase domain-containing protein [Sphingomicrobium astaxanthinifaciens]MCJ7421548.1 PAS domain S-box protein [Sphingomicrobium astaxanthinifaciens]
MAASLIPAPAPHLDPILATVLDAVVMMTEDGVIAGWNSVAEQTFGWTAREAQGQILSQLIVPAQYRQAHRDGLARLANGGEPRVLHRRIEITALHRDGHEIPVELAITAAKPADIRVYVGFIRDISDRREAEAKLEKEAKKNRLMFNIVSMAASTSPFDTILKTALEACCQIIGWPVGHAFIVAPGPSPELRSSGVWFETTKGQSDRIRFATEEIVFERGLGLPGTILATGKSHWIADTDDDANFPRRGNGFRGAFGFPVKCDGRIVAILEFFSEMPVSPDAELLLTVRAVGEQVGRVLERQSAAERQSLLLNEFRHRVKNVLSVVHAVANQTFRMANTKERAHEVFSGRLMAMAAAQDLLVAQKGTGAQFGDIIKAALVGSGVCVSRINYSGPQLVVSSRHAVTISLAIHELTTNAFKYGSLSTDRGSVRISWDVDGNNQFNFEWREIEGPIVAEPKRKGFGSNLLERGLAHELGGRVKITYCKSGLVCKFTGPVDDLRK